MRIRADISALRETTWREYAIRFVLGGAITVITGLLAARFGPVFGGLFLAFPAIFPASATLVEKHEREKKQKAGIWKSIRGRQAATLDARGAQMGSIGLMVFALATWKILLNHNAVAILFAALGLWLGVSVLLWQLRRKHYFCR